MRCSANDPKMGSCTPISDGFDVIKRKKEKKKKKEEDIKESLNRSAIYFSNGWARASAETRRRGANREAKIPVKGVFDGVASTRTRGGEKRGGGDLLAGSIRGSALAFISIVASSSSRAAFSPGSYSGSPLRLNGRSSRANRFHKPDRLSPGRFRLNRSTFKSCVHEDLPFQRLINWPLGKRKLVSLPDPCLAEFRFQIFLIKLRSFKIRRIIIYIHINVLFARTRRGFVSIPLLVPSYWDFVSSAIEHF